MVTKSVFLRFDFHLQFKTSCIFQMGENMPTPWKLGMGKCEKWSEDKILQIENGLVGSERKLVDLWCAILTNSQATTLWLQTFQERRFCNYHLNEWLNVSGYKSELNNCPLKEHLHPGGIAITGSHPELMSCAVSTRIHQRILTKQRRRRTERGNAVMGSRWGAGCHRARRRQLQHPAARLVHSQ